MASSGESSCEAEESGRAIGGGGGVASGSGSGLSRRRLPLSAASRRRRWIEAVVDDVEQHDDNAEDDGDGVGVESSSPVKDEGENNDHHDDDDDDDDEDSCDEGLIERIRQWRNNDRPPASTSVVKPLAGVGSSAAGATTDDRDDNDDYDSGYNIPNKFHDLLGEAQHYLALSMFVYMYAQLREMAILGYTEVDFRAIDVNSYLPWREEEEEEKGGGGWGGNDERDDNDDDMDPKQEINNNRPSSASGGGGPPSAHLRSISESGSVGSSKSGRSRSRNGGIIGVTLNRTTSVRSLASAATADYPSYIRNTRGAASIIRIILTELEREKLLLREKGDEVFGSEHDSSIFKEFCKWVNDSKAEQLDEKAEQVILELRKKVAASRWKRSGAAVKMAVRLRKRVTAGGGANLAADELKKTLIEQSPTISETERTTGADDDDNNDDDDNSDGSSNGNHGGRRDAPAPLLDGPGSPSSPLRSSERPQFSARRPKRIGRPSARSSISMSSMDVLRLRQSLGEDDDDDCDDDDENPKKDGGRDDGGPARPAALRTRATSEGGGGSAGLRSSLQSSIGASLERRRSALSRTSSVRGGGWFALEKRLIEDHFGVLSTGEGGDLACEDGTVVRPNFTAAAMESQELTKMAVDRSLIETVLDQRLGTYFKKRSVLSRMIESGIEVAWFGDRHSSEAIYCICICRDTKTITVVFRGSVTAHNWKQNLKFMMTEQSNPVSDENYEGRTEHIRLHTGFGLYLLRQRRDTGRSKYTEIAEKVRSIGTDLAPDGRYRLTVAGHSLGGALATIFSFYAAADGRFTKVEPVRTFTFAAPRVGDAAFAAAYGHLERTGRVLHARISNCRDVVPLIPMFSMNGMRLGRSYEHVGLQVRLHEVNALGKWRIQNALDVTHSARRGWRNKLRMVWKNNLLSNVNTIGGFGRCHILSTHQKRLNFTRQYRVGLGQSKHFSDRRRRHLKSLEEYYRIKMHGSASVPRALDVSAEKGGRRAIPLYVLIGAALAFFLGRKYPGSCPTLMADMRDGAVPAAVDEIADDQMEVRRVSEDAKVGKEEEVASVELGVPVGEEGDLVSKEQVIAPSSPPLGEDAQPMIKSERPVAEDGRTAVDAKASEDELGLSVVQEETEATKGLILTERSELCFKSFIEDIIIHGGISEPVQIETDERSATHRDRARNETASMPFPPLPGRRFWGVRTNPAFVCCGAHFHLASFALPPEVVGSITLRSNDTVVSKIQQVWEDIENARLSGDEKALKRG